MRVTLLTASVSRRAGGMLEAMRGLTGALRGSPGVEVRVLGLADDDTQRDLPAWDGAPVSAAPVKGPQWFGYAPSLTTALLESRADLVHVHGLWMFPSVACLKWTRRTRRPYLVAPHGMLDSWALRNFRWKKLAAGWAYENAHLRGAACLHALCDAEAGAMRTYGLRNPICVVANGVSLPPASPACRPEWAADVADELKVLLYLGRLHPKKNLGSLLRAWRLARENSIGAAQEWHLVVAGWDQGGQESRLERLSRELDIQRSVHFVGPQFSSAKGATYRRAEAFILPSLSEGLPMTVLEAWSYGLPVLMTAECNLPEGFAASAALRIEPDAAGLARALSEFFAATDADRAAMGERGRDLVARRYSWEAIGGQMCAVYEWLLGGAAPSNVELVR